MTFFNTTREKGRRLLGYRVRAASQQDQILHFFLDHPGVGYTPSAIHHRLFGPSTPLTSIRRAISNLTQERKLVKTGRKVQGVYGRPEHQWKLNEPEPAQQSLALGGTP
jgi:hypothetical protein